MYPDGISFPIDLYMPGERMHFSFPLMQLSRLIFALSLATIVSGINLSPTVQAQDQMEVSLDQFDILTASSGWILLDQHLFWTSNAGQTWNEISPSISSDAFIQDVELIDHGPRTAKVVDQLPADFGQVVGPELRGIIDRWGP